MVRRKLCELTEKEIRRAKDSMYRHNKRGAIIGGTRKKKRRKNQLFTKHNVTVGPGCFCGFETPTANKKLATGTGYYDGEKQGDLRNHRKLKANVCKSCGEMSSSFALRNGMCTCDDLNHDSTLQFTFISRRTALDKYAKRATPRHKMELSIHVCPSTADIVTEELSCNPGNRTGSTQDETFQRNYQTFVEIINSCLYTFYTTMSFNACQIQSQVASHHNDIISNICEHVDFKLKTGDCSPFWIIIIGHGDPDGHLIVENEAGIKKRISLNDLLRDINLCYETKPPFPVNLLLASCYGYLYDKRLAENYWFKVHHLANSRMHNGSIMVQNFQSHCTVPALEEFFDRNSYI